MSAFAAPGENGPVKSDKVGIYEPWEILSQKLPDAMLSDRAFIRPAGGRQVLLELNQIKTLLAGAPLESANRGVGIQAAPVVIALPKPDGTFERFEIFESPVYEPGFSAEFPDIKTYRGESLDSPQSNVRCDVTPFGFRAQVLSSEGSYWIDPVSFDDVNLYTSYSRRDLQRSGSWSCLVTEDEALPGIPQADNPFEDRVATDANRKNYRAAVAGNFEYTSFHGGTVALGQAAIVTAMNRINQVYENDLNIHMNLVANNSSIVWATSADPYTNGNGSTMLSQNQTSIDSIIGSANYDIGHVFSTGGGGVAGLGVVCTAGNKARGVTGQGSPTGDPFWIDYVAHEMGHQFGGNHTFNGADSNCGSNRAASAAYEPGSGSTIMAYAGICSPNDLQSNSDPYFHTKSFEEITNTMNAKSCQTTNNTGNTTPTVSAGNFYTLPIQTPYTLTATGFDADNDALTYCWEQYFLGGSQTASGIPSNFPDTSGKGPYQRSWNPTTSPSRQFPRNSNLLANNLAFGETLPLITRAMAYRVTVRDGNGGVNVASVNISTSSAAGPFLVTSPNTAVSWAGSSTQNVTWNVANTTAAPVSCANVDILLSTNGGATFPTVLASNVPNSGSASVVIPNSASTTARIKVQASDNIFFDISNTNFTITAVANPSNPTGPSANPSSVCSGGDVTLSVDAPPGGVVIDWYSGSCGGTFVATGTSINVNPVAATSYFARARRTSDNAMSAGCASASVSILPSPVDPTGASSDRDNLCQFDGGNVVLTAAGGSGTTLRWFADSCAGTQIGTGNGLSIAAPSTTTTYYARWETSCGVSECASVTVTVRSCPADFNCDGVVEDSDFVIFANSYDIFDCGDEAMINNCAADINGDGFVDDTDFVMFAGAYDAFVCPE
ncbi:MAG: hypothetical protein KF805_08040 [Phycisphaeraceae bacterium]|nr:hypothetical protein [Phycisphaeraceae bacterium]